MQTGWDAPCKPNAGAEPGTRQQAVQALQVADCGTSAATEPDSMTGSCTGQGILLCTRLTKGSDKGRDRASRLDETTQLETGPRPGPHISTDDRLTGTADGQVPCGDRCLQQAPAWSITESNHSCWPLKQGLS